jgi:hypothetical protein
LLLDLIRDLEFQGKKPEQLPVTFWAEACLRILLNRSPYSGGEGIPCAI